MKIHELAWKLASCLLDFLRFLSFFAFVSPLVARMTPYCQ